MMHCCVDIDVSLCTCISGGEKPKFGPNTSEFVRRFDAGTTEGQGICTLISDLYCSVISCLLAIEQVAIY